DGLLWFWPQGENPWAVRHQVDDRLRFLAPFDPVVWDRRRFQLFWSWEYKLEAYVPLCASPQAPHGPLRDAHAMGRANAGLGQSEGRRWTAAARAARAVAVPRRPGARDRGRRRFRRGGARAAPARLAQRDAPGARRRGSGRRRSLRGAAGARGPPARDVAG